MEVKFDKFSRFETPNFYLCNPGCVLNGSGSLSNMVGVLDITSDEQLSLNFNATSDLAFRAYKKGIEDSDETAPRNLKIFGHSLQGASPSPDSPQGFTNVEQIRISAVGKNLLPPETQRTGHAGVSYEVINGRFHAYGTNVYMSYSGQNIPKENCIYHLKKGTYTLAVYGLEEGGQVAFTYHTSLGETRLYVKSTPRTFVLTEDAVYSWFFCVPAGTHDSIYEVQLERGYEATDFETYIEQSRTITPPMPLHKIYSYRDVCDVQNGVWRYDTGELSFRISNMNNSESYPGWRNTGVTGIVGSGKNQLLNGYSATNIGGYVGVNTMYETSPSSGTMWLTTSAFPGMKQTNWKADYPELTVDVIIARLDGSIEYPINPDDLAFLQGLSEVRDDLTISILDQAGNYLDWEFAMDSSRSALSKKINATYNAIKNRRLIYLDDLGFFVITEVTEGYSDGLTYKDVTARSCEEEIAGRNVPFIEDGTYKFLGDVSGGATGQEGLLEKLVALCPLWTIGNVDETVKAKHRSFEDVDTSKNILGFMLEDMQDAYECIFVFDIEHRLIHVYDQANYVMETDIHITKDDLITALDIVESSEDLYTAITVSGDEELGISAINPLGGNTIYDFSYYLDWMTPELSAAVATWQNLVTSAKTQYYNYQNRYYELSAELSNLNSEREKINTQLTMYQRCKENCVVNASEEDISKYNAFIEQAGGTPIPDNLGYIWIKFADDANGLGMTSDPTDKAYIGLAYGQNSKTESLDPADYSWSLFRDTGVVTAGSKYTWITFADTSTSGMSREPEGKAYIGLAIDKESSVRSTDYTDYMWFSTAILAFGVPQVLDKFSELIEEANEQLAIVEAAIEEKTAESDGIKAEAAIIRGSVAFQSYFTLEQMEELQCYIFEGEYTDEYVTVTEDMTPTEQFSQMNILYTRALDQLKKISTPSQKFEVDLENFIFAKEFEPWSNQLQTGCLINVELDDDNVAKLFLANIEVNYDDRQLSMTFGNRYNQYDTMSLFKDALGDIQKTANTLSYVKDSVYPIKNGEFDAMKEAIETSRTLTKDAVLASANEEVLIDDSGYTGRRVFDDGTIDPQQIKINGRNIVFTDDAWETCRTAIGELYLSGGETAYGINAEILLGNLIMGNELKILDANGNDMFTVSGNEIIGKISEKYDGTISSLNGDLQDFKTSVSSEIRQTAMNVVESYNYNGILNELSETIENNMVSILGEIAHGIVTDPSTGNRVMGIAISEKLEFTGQTESIGNLTYYELADHQTFGLYTATGWQFWVDGQKCGWYDSSDGGMLHVVNMVAESKSQIGDNWAMLDMDGFGIRYIGE